MSADSLPVDIKEKLIEKFTDAVSNGRIVEWSLERASFVAPSTGEFVQHEPSGTIYYTVTFWEYEPRDSPTA